MIAIFPKITHYANRQDYERLACLVRQYFGAEQTYSPKLDIRKLISSLGISLGHLVLDNRGAIVVKDERGRFQVAVGYNPQGLEEHEERFILAHFLGHFIMHIQPSIASGELLTNGFRELILPSTRYGQGINQGKTLSAIERREEEADRFAATLLMPVGLVKRALERFPDPQALSTCFGMSYAVMTRRLAQLGLFTERSSGFLHDEHLLRPEEPSVPIERDPAHEKSPVRAQVTPPNIKKINEILASNNYSSKGRPGRGTDATAPAPAVQSTQAGTKAHPAEKSTERDTSVSGMERIREIARKIDISVG